jgi:hypothetical protein
MFFSWPYLLERQIVKAPDTLQHNQCAIILRSPPLSPEVVDVRLLVGLGRLRQAEVCKISSIIMEFKAEMGKWLNKGGKLRKRLNIFPNNIFLHKPPQ